MLLSLLATYFIRVAATASGVSDKMETIIRLSRFPDHETPLRTVYTGIALLDQGFAFLVAAFIHGTAAWDRGFHVLQIYFLISLFPILAIWSVESCRKRNRLSLISL